VTTAVPIIRQEGEGERLWFAGGGIFTLKASADETNGAFFLIEDRMVRGKVTPLHLHPYEDEIIYVLDGELLIHLEDGQHRLGRHGLFVAPRGVPHAFMVTSETAHVISFQTPGTGEPFYRAATEPADEDADAGRTDWPRLREAAERFDTIQLLGPPPFASDAQASAVTT
jgi:quercetin dioxygenase-like cupin family protein